MPAYFPQTNADICEAQHNQICKWAWYIGF